ncbi:hypothetical protein [Ectobacillus sp. sgz5001026]|uniref:hypothetical protein n=1 Tax=Ectobacillus sp. sgz5001026 TaxID=3242473 RepID=UPI0036D36CDE
MNRETELVINDYLDLYLYAGSINDTAWQKDILDKLQFVRTEEKQDTFSLQTLWDQYNSINQEILTIYHQLQTKDSSSELDQKLWNLKQTRVSLGKQIRLAYIQSKQIS